MSNGLLASAGITVIALILLAPVPAAGQAQTTAARPPSAAATTWTPPRTPWGHPDLQGVWNNNTVVPLERPEALAEKEVLTDQEVAARFQENSERLFAPREGSTGFYNEFWFEYGQDTNRTSLIVDPPGGRLPPLTPEAAARTPQRSAAASAEAGSIGSWEDLSLFDRCITRGLPGAMMPGFYNHNYHILQTPDYVVLLVEMIHDARIIPLDRRPHLPRNVSQWLGDSRGYWEGNTLVVETTNFKTIGVRTTTVFGGSEKVRLVERFTRVDADRIDYRYTFDDPTEFASPWTAAIPMNRVDGAIFEYACHEGNYAMSNSLSGARAKEAADEAAGKKP